MREAGSRGAPGYQPFFPRLRESLPNEAVDVDLPFLREDLVHGGPGRGVRWAEEVADLRPLGDLVRANLARDPDGLLLVEPDERSENDNGCRRVNRPQVLEGLARDLTEALPREQVRASLPPSDRLGDPDHEPLREDEVQLEVARLRDLREGRPHGHDEELREAELLGEPAGLHRRRVVGDRLQGAVDREDVEP